MEYQTINPSRSLCLGNKISSSLSSKVVAYSAVPRTLKEWEAPGIKVKIMQELSVWASRNKPKALVKVAARFSAVSRIRIPSEQVHKMLWEEVLRSSEVKANLSKVRRERHHSSGVLSHKHRAVACLVSHNSNNLVVVYLEVVPSNQAN